MIYRELGNTGIKVSEVGMGCNRLREPYWPDAHWIRLVENAVDRGINIFDTAESYKGGGSEEILGQVVGNREDLLVATKMGGPGRDFSANQVIACAEASLKRLRRDRIDIFHLHSPNRQEMKQYDWTDGMTKLKEEGKIKFRAVSANNPEDAIWLIKLGRVEVLQITYNIFNIEAEERLFSVASKYKVGIVCRMPLAQGILTGKFRPGEEVPEDHRAHRAYQHMNEQIDMAEDLRPLGSTYKGGMTRLALHFCLTPQAISTIIPGSRTTEQLDENVIASNGSGLSEKTRSEIDRKRAMWVE